MFADFYWRGPSSRRFTAFCVQLWSARVRFQLKDQLKYRLADLPSPGDCDSRIQLICLFAADAKVCVLLLPVLH
jgi:hypothetical protein